VTSDTRHGSTILSADFLWQLNHADKSWPILSIVLTWRRWAEELLLIGDELLDEFALLYECSRRHTELTWSVRRPHQRRRDDYRQVVHSHLIVSAALRHPATTPYSTSDLDIQGV